MTTIPVSRMIITGLILTCGLVAQEKKEAMPLKESMFQIPKRTEVKRMTPKDANNPSLSNFDAFGNIVRFAYRLELGSSCSCRAPRL